MADDLETTDKVEPEDTELDTELASVAVDDGKGNKMVPLSALAGAKKESRASAKRVKELEAKEAEYGVLKQRLDSAQPIIDAIVNNPKLSAEARKIASGIKPTSDKVDQPDVHEDPDAVAYAETMDLYTKEGNLDVVKARKALDVVTRVSGRMANEAVKPFAGMMLGSNAERNLV